ncbi:hypothetical protein BDN70DRAFT_398686 [Pholiota conissans]|uniref:Uncharacterized protein n=1 Tax=Pholiota conissans TaxID=109636 RepID=A0A9P6CTR4_9AGAR|nr:hypothetical protein BDN70DRAFT_398686 [Pholiota conissans]
MTQSCLALSNHDPSLLPCLSPMRPVIPKAYAILWHAPNRELLRAAYHFIKCAFRPVSFDLARPRSPRMQSIIDAADLVGPVVPCTASTSRVLQTLSAPVAFDDFLALGTLCRLSSFTVRLPRPLLHDFISDLRLLSIGQCTGHEKRRFEERVYRVWYSGDWGRCPIGMSPGNL